MAENMALDLGSFDFTPDWAKKGAGVTVGKVRGGDVSERGGAGERKGAFEERRGERKPFGDRKPHGERKPFGDRKGGGERPRFDRKPRYEDRPKPLDAEIKVLPETKALGTIIRKLQGDFHAYKLKDLAYFFLDNPSSVLLRVAPAKKEGAEPVRFHQCKACGFASMNEEDVIEHVLTAHLGDYYEVREIEVEPPKGNFNCVAKCGLSGVLLGPPNVHEFGGIVREMIRTRYPEMSESQYRSHIEMVRDAEAIEQWRQSAVKKTVFVVKGGGEESPNLTREQAEGEFKRTILPSMLDEPKTLMITADKAMESADRTLANAARSALEGERRSPYNMCFALRGAFHHRKLNFFRTNDAHGQEFVCGAALKEFDGAHAIPELATIAAFIAEHPCSTKQEIAKDPEAEKHLMWLVSTGHVVAFTNGVYSAVEKFPKYGPQWRKKSDKAEKPEEAKAEASVEASVEAPVEGTQVVEEEKKNESTAELAE